MKNKIEKYVQGKVVLILELCMMVFILLNIVQNNANNFAKVKVFILKTKMLSIEITTILNKIVDLLIE